MQRCVYKTAKYPTPFEKTPWVNYQGDMYIEEDGARYEVTKFPNDVDALGLLHSPIGSAPDISLQQGIGVQENVGAKGSSISPNYFDWGDENDELFRREDMGNRREGIDNVARF